jgi:predicted nucleotidyltransferase
MDKSAQTIFLGRWLRTTLKSIWSKRAAIIFVLSFVLAEIIWWRFYGFEKAREQAIENIIPVFAGAIITVVVMAIIKFFEVRALIRSEGNELCFMMKQQDDQAKTISVWLSRHLANANIGISEAYLFGSVTHNDYESHDVDVVLMFKDMKDKEYIKKERKLTAIAEQFNETFGKQIHFQRFLASESGEFQRFISMQSASISILQGQQ